MVGNTKQRTLIDVQVQVLTCNNCGLSKNCRSPIPVSTKISHPKYIVLGEAPGQIEDRKGEPFSGPAGTFLRRSLQRAGLSPSDGAWMNTVSCYPSEHKTPAADEVQACRKNLRDQLEVLPTSYVLVCGAVALNAVMPNAQLTYASGVPYLVHGKVMFPVYHPAFILRSRVAQSGWDRDLTNFARMVNLNSVPAWQDLQHGHCAYCNRGVMENGVTCSQHERLFNQDSIWKAPKVVKAKPLQLFD